MGANGDNGFKFRKDLTLLGLGPLNLPRVNEPDVFHLDLPIPPNLPGTLQHPRFVRVFYMQHGTRSRNFLQLTPTIKGKNEDTQINMSSYGRDVDGIAGARVKPESARVVGEIACGTRFIKVLLRKAAAPENCLFVLPTSKVAPGIVDSTRSKASDSRKSIIFNDRPCLPTPKGSGSAIHYAVWICCWWFFEYIGRNNDLKLGCVAEAGDNRTVLTDVER
ncbi:hypothetical protein PAXINDRAFT_158236 [Paxillus involutus ATCC 200175]|uniref:Uncharacterized protein n=1 Tax=Paxillus involutus ATCC 200175 TaxID=664439 RepID=A0A0C9TJG1_PAXIN|nr:hypothetical protein PAXINDRAFT_158236 [Paxillus involutus ATCC 200175]